MINKCINHTNPIFGWVEFLIFVDNGIKDHQNQQGWVVSDDCLGARKLTIIDHVEPCGEKEYPWGAIKYCLQW